jgi:hypothetical protein
MDFSSSLIIKALELLVDWFSNLPTSRGGGERRQRKRLANVCLQNYNIYDLKNELLRNQFKIATYDNRKNFFLFSHNYRC